MPPTTNANTKSGGGTGKAARAKAAKMGLEVVTDLTHHRACGGGPIADDLDASSSDYVEVVQTLERLETAARIKHLPHMIQRREVPMDNHGSMIVPSASSERTQAQENAGDGFCDMSERGLRGELAIERISESLQAPMSLSSVIHLNLSRNEIWDLPSGLKTLTSLRHLDLSRNWFSALPKSVVDLLQLETLDVSHNMLRSSQSALLMTEPDKRDGTAICALQSLPNLKVLDLRFNQKCGHQKLQDKLCNLLPSTDIRMTISFPPPEGAFVGGSAAERDPSLLRSQLEPWPTTALRRRLVADFGEEPSSPETFTRADVMDRLLDLYEKEENDRAVVRVEGAPVNPDILRDLRAALAEWSDGWKDGNQERVSINAEN